MAQAAQRLGLRHVVVTSVTQFSNGFGLTAKDARRPAQGQITLTFANDPMRLSDWTMTDARGQTTRVQITSLEPAEDADPSLFDGPEDEKPDVRAAREDVAREICASCPVRQNCLDFANRMRARSGIWGGLDYRERLAHFRKLRHAEAAAAELEQAS